MMLSRSRPGLFALFLLLCLGLVAVPSVLADDEFEFGRDDDFAFGQKLAQNRYFELARKVFEGIIANPNRSEEDKDEARYGLALLAREEALAAVGRPDVPYADVKALFDSAVKDVTEFVRKNPDNANTAEAKLNIGTIRLAFVQWARELLGDGEEMATRGTQGDTVGADAKDAVDEAISYFDGLRPAPDNLDPTPLEDLAQYYYVISQYYRALVFPPCSAAAVQALANAGDLLEEYIMDHDGQLLAVYAQDIYGLVWWELAKCESDKDKQQTLYGNAFEWFVTCIDTEDQGPDFLRVITSGYYHVAQAGLAAGRMPDRNFEKEAVAYLEEMLKRHPTAWRTENGLRALIEWSKIECQRSNPTGAIEVAKEAAERAKTAGMPHLERIANRQLNEYVSGGCGGGTSSGGQDPVVLKRVADDLFLRGRYSDAIRAYQQVLAAIPDTREGFVNYGWHAWERIAASYNRLDDRLGEALAYEPVHDAWINGLIRNETGQEDDPTLFRAGQNRRFSQVALKAVADLTGSRVIEARYKAMRDEFINEYPGHPSSRAGEWNAAMDKWNTAKDQKKANDATWRTTLAEAIGHLRNVATDMKGEKQDQAWVFLVLAERELESPQRVVERADEAAAYWADPERTEQEEKFDAVRTRRLQARAAVTFWKAEALFDLGKAAESVALLADYHAKFPDADKPYPSLAYGTLVEAYLTVGDVDAADRTYRTLLRVDPEFFNLANITFKLAGYYNAKRQEIEDRLRTTTQELNLLLPDLRVAQREEARLELQLADWNNRRTKYETALRLDKEAKERGEESPVTPGYRTEAERNLPGLLEKIEAATRRLAEVKRTRQDLDTKVNALREQQEALKQEIYAPLVKAAGYYKDWDDALKSRDLTRSWDNLSAFAQMFWFAGKLRPEIVENWQNAKALYEDYLGSAVVKLRPTNDPDKRAAVSRLGDVLAHLAEVEADPGLRKQLVQQAVQFMQQSIAENPENNDLIVGMLSSKLLILSWRHPREQRRYRFPIPLPADVDALKAAVQTLGTSGGFPLPVYDDDEKRRNYERALIPFKDALLRESNANLERLVQSAGKSSFDPTLYRDLADSDPEFMLALAWAYTESGQDEDLPKAITLARNLVSSQQLAVPEDTPEWWRARTILFRAMLNTARAGAGAAGADTAQWLDHASATYKGVAANYPDFGESITPGNKAVWEAFLEQLNDLRREAGLPDTTITIQDLGAEGGDAPPNNPGDSEEQPEDDQGN
ncbi:MAG: hypothetical protein ACYTG6_12010 [Planctomycetota bacterium]